MLSPLHHGIPPVDSKYETFLDQKFIHGGNTNNFTYLPLQLSEREAPTPVYANVHQWYQRQDVCAAQYHEKGIFWGWKIMAALHSIVCKDWTKITMHGRDVSDCDGSAVGGVVKCSFSDIYGSGAQNIVCHLAASISTKHLLADSMLWLERSFMPQPHTFSGRCN
jgi:hypothetical protein